MSPKNSAVRVSIDLSKALRNRMEKAAAAEGKNFPSAARVAFQEWTDRVLSENKTSK